MISFVLEVVASFIGCLLALIAYGRFVKPRTESKKINRTCFYEDEYSEFIKVPED